MKVEIRPHKISDAKRLFEIVSDDKYSGEGKSLDSIMYSLIPND